MRKIFALMGGIALFAGIVPASADSAKMNERLTDSTAVLHEIMATPDRAVPNSILSGASCVVVIPAFKKGAFLVGAQYGQGVATCRTPHGWSAPVYVRLSGGSFGFQVGGQSTDLVLIAMNQNGLQKMLKNKFKIGADAAASAGPVGRNAQAGTDWKLNAEFLTYSRSKGLFAGIDLDGTVLDDNNDDMREAYGENVQAASVLRGDVAVPQNARRFVHTVAQYFQASK